MRPAHKVEQQAKSGPDIINFAGYEWYTNYHHNLDSGYYNNGQQWAPQNATVVNGQLHLTLKDATVDNKYRALSSSEAVLVATSSGQPFNPGYGTYLVSAETAGSFNRLANNNGAIFGAFTYEGLRGNGRLAGDRITGVPANVLATLKPGFTVAGGVAINDRYMPFFAPGTSIREIQGGTIILNQSAIFTPSGDHTIYFADNTVVNSHRELDVTETSRFGVPSDPNNSQFTLQPHGSNPKNVHRFFMPEQGQITVVMNWKGANQPVTFSEYAGLYNLSNLPASATYSWTTPPDLNDFIPNSSLQTFHLNLWRQHWNSKIPNPRPDEVTVTNFQYVPLS